MPVHAPISTSFHRPSNKVSEASQQSNEYNNYLNQFSYNQYNAEDVAPHVPSNSGNEMKFKFVIGKNNSSSSSGSSFKHPSKPNPSSSFLSQQYNENDKNKYLSSTGTHLTLFFVYITLFFNIYFIYYIIS
jgi:hypothetical protein